MQLRKIVGDSLALLSLEVVAKILPLVTFPLVAQALGPDIFGKVGFAGAVIGFFGLIASPGFGAYGTREVARDSEGTRRIASSVVGARLTFSVFAYTLLVLYTFTFAPPDAMTRELILLSGVGMLIGAIDVGWIFAGNSRMWMLSLPGIAWQVVAAAATLCLIRRPSDAELMLAIGSVLSLCAVVFIYFRARRDYGVGLPSIKPSAWKPILPTCFTLGLAGLFTTVYCQIDAVMIGYMRSSEELGLYSAALRVTAVGMTLVGVLGPVFMPQLSKAASQGDADREQKLTQWFVTGSVLLAVPVVTTGLLLAEPISALFLTASFRDAVPLIRLLMPVVLLAPIAGFCCSRLIPHGRERKYLVCVGAGAGVNVVLNLLFIPRYGAHAAAIATAFAELAVALCGCYFSRDLVRPRIKSLLIVTAVGAGLMAMTILFIGRHLPSMHVAATIVCAACVYALVCRTLLKHREVGIKREWYVKLQRLAASHT